jgi:glycosyltransferase involved in cell wall biosynthesis
MAEPRKKRIVIASVLKPVDDTRMFGKIATTLAENKLFSVDVIGCAGHRHNRSVQQLSIGSFSRISFSRWFASWRIIWLALRLQPDLLIICTHELLFAATLLKMFRGSKIVYDVQENYYLNIRHTKAFPRALRKLIADYVRVKEKLCSRWVDLFFLAEKTYQSELTFIGSRFIVLENKVQSSNPHEKRPIGDRVNLIFTGTLAESTGVYLAIKVASAMYRVDKNVTLTIVGYAPHQSTFSHLTRLSSDLSFIKLIAGTHQIPHHEIVRFIQDADAGIISYPANPSTQNRVPTKLYEYLAHHLPIIMVNNKHWVSIANRFSAAIVFSENSINGNELLNELRTGKFYIHQEDESQLTWESEKDKLRRAVTNLIE